MKGVYEFTMPKGRLILLAICLVASGILLFSAGIITGFLLEKTEPQLRVAEKASPVEHKPEVSSLPKNSTKPDAAAPQPANGLVVQVATFQTKARADNMADALKRQGVPRISVMNASTQNETWYVVRTGPYPDWDSATQAAAVIDKAFSIRTQLMMTRESGMD
jgi:cell division septation protein DedD